MQSSVACLRIFPGITEATVRAFLAPPMQGVVLETYGAGNAPSNRPDLLAIIKEACDRGVVIVNCSQVFPINQCKKGLVSDMYETGKALGSTGVVPGSDMTPECALTKLSYLLGKYPNLPKTCRALLQRNLRGELTVATQRFKFAAMPIGSNGVFDSVMTLLSKNSSAEHLVGQEDSDRIDPTQELENTLVPLLLCKAARKGDVKTLESVIGEFEYLIDTADYDGRTPLHIACSEGQIDSVKFLLLHGANLHLRDRYNNSVLMDAIRFTHQDIVRLLIDSGAHFSPEESEDVCTRFCASIRYSRRVQAKLFVEAGADISCSFQDGKTPLHLASEVGDLELLELMIEQAVSQREKLAPHKPSPGPSDQIVIRENLNLKSSKDIIRPHSRPLMNAPITLEPVDMMGETPRECAKKRKNIEIVSALDAGIKRLKAVKK